MVRKTAKYEMDLWKVGTRSGFSNLIVLYRGKTHADAGNRWTLTQNLKVVSTDVYEQDYAHSSIPQCFGVLF